MFCPYCGVPEVPEGTACPSCGVWATLAAESEIAKVRFLLTQVDEWERGGTLAADSCRLLRKRYAQALEDFAKLLADPAQRPATRHDHAVAMRIRIAAAAEATPPGAPESATAAAGPAGAHPVEGPVPVPATAVPADASPAASPTTAPATAPIGTEPARTPAASGEAVSPVPVGTVPEIVWLTPDTPAAPPRDPAEELRRRQALERLYGRPTAAPAPTAPPAPAPAPTARAPGAAEGPTAPARAAAGATGTAPARPAPAEKRPARRPQPARPEYVPPPEPAGEPGSYRPLEEEIPLAERLKNLLTERNVRILFNIGLSILFGGLAIFIRIYWKDYSRTEQILYLLGGTTAAAAAGLFLRQTELLRTSGSYLLVAASASIPLDVFAWTEADILPRASAEAIGLATSAGCIALNAWLLAWLRERVLGYLAVLSLVAAYGFGLRILGADLEHLSAWMPLLFAGLTAVAARLPEGPAPGATPIAPPAPALASSPDSEPASFASLLRIPLLHASIAGTPLALLVAAFQFLLEGTYGRPADFPFLQLLLHSGAGHALLARILHRRDDVVWLAAGLHLLALVIVFQHSIPRPDWGPWAMAIGAVGAFAIVSVRPHIGAGSALPYQSLAYFLMAAALLDSGIRFLLHLDPPHAGSFLLTLAFPAGVWGGLSLQAGNERYALRVAILLHVEAVLAFFWLGWPAIHILSGAAACSGAFILMGTLPPAGRLAPYPPALNAVGYTAMSIGLVGAILLFFVSLAAAPLRAAQAAASYGAVVALVAAQKKDAPHLAVALTLLVAALAAGLRHAGLDWIQVPLGLSACAALLAAASFASAPWVSSGTAVTSHLAAVVAAAALLGAASWSPARDTFAFAANASLLALAYGLHGAVARRTPPEADAPPSTAPPSAPPAPPAPSTAPATTTAAGADFFELVSLALAGSAAVLFALDAGLHERHLAVALALLGVLYLGAQRLTRALPGRAFCWAAGALALLALWGGFGLALTLHLFTGSITHAEAALASCTVVAALIACALVEDPPAGQSPSALAGTAAVFFAYPYVSLAWAAIAAPAGRIAAVAGLCVVYTAVERAVRDTRWSVLAAPTAVMNFLAVVALVGVGLGYGVAKGDASLPSLATGLAAVLLTYYAFAATPPPAFPPLVASTGSAFLFTAAYALFLAHISTGSNLGGIAFLASTYVLGIVSLVLRHRGKTPQWKPYFATSLVNAGIALLLAFPHPGIRAWVLFGTTLLFGGYGIVLETKLFTYLACFALSGAYVSVLESAPGISKRHYVFWILALAMAKTVAGGFLARREERAAEQDPAPAARPVHPAFHVGVALSFLALGMIFMDASYYLKAEYWLAIGCAWACAVLYLLAWLVARQDVYLYLSAMSVAGSYFVWLQNQEVSAWEWYTLPLGVLAIAWARTLGARRLDPDQTRLVDGVALAITLGPSLLQSLSSANTKNAALAFVLAVAMVVLGMGLKRKLYLFAGILAVAVELVIQLIHLVDFGSFGAVHYFILIGAGVMLFAMVLNYFLSKSMQAKASEAKARVREFFLEWD